jgi:uncharacterized membrane protein YraQ (UPF0718 family)
MLLPTCECGVVSIVRRFLKKDVPPHIAITYMLSAPVINPLVLAATYVAFQGNIWMVLGRAGLVAACAGSLGWALSGIRPAHLIRQAERQSLRDHDSSAGAGSDKRGEPNFSHGMAHDSGPGKENGKTKIHPGLPAYGFRVHGYGKFLVLAGIVVGLLKVFLPEDALVLFRENTSWPSGP